jgi:hypothetical protein
MTHRQSPESIPGRAGVLSTVAVRAATAAYVPGLTEGREWVTDARQLGERMSATDLAAATGAGGNGHGNTWILVVWGVLAMVIGGINLLNPMAPSDAALGLSRVSGGVFVIIGAVFFVYGLTRL